MQKVLLNYESCHKIVYFNQNTFILCIMESELRVNRGPVSLICAICDNEILLWSGNSLLFIVFVN